MISRLFLDTNILIYSRDEASPLFQPVRDALRGLVDAEIGLCISRQVLREYVAVVTRPPPRGLGASVQEALQQVAEFERFYRVLADPENVWETWKQVVRESGLTGLRIRDAYLAAVMKEHQVEVILTLNGRDFQPIAGLTIVAPQDWNILVETEEDEETEP